VTFGALSLSDAAPFREPVAPLVPQVKRLSRSDVGAAVAAIRSGRPAAVVVEAVQAESGVVELTTEYLRAVRAACDETGSLLIADEVQCGLGRCGTRQAIDAAGVVPDVLILGDASGGVVPAAVVVTRPEVFAPFDRDPSLHASASGGHPLAATALAATIEVVLEDDVPAQACALGARVHTLLTKLQVSSPDVFARVTGRGLMLGLHCRRQSVARRFVRSCLARGILLVPCLVRPDVVRVSPPVVLADGDLRWLEGALAEAAAEARRPTVD
jgi:putrescine aminotransferase